MNYLVMCLLAIMTLVGGVDTACASEAAFAKAMARGVAAIEAGNHALAETEFRGALAEQPDDPEATLYLGVALARQKEPKAEEILKKALVLAPDNARTNLELGILYHDRKIFDEAADYFDNAIKVAPGTESALASAEYLRKIRGQSAEQRWLLRFMTGLQYDSNVLLNADSSPLPQGISGKSDWRGIFNLRGGYSLIKSENFELFAGGGFYQSLHTKLDDFNITQNLLELSATWKATPIVSLKGGYTFEYLLLGGEAYDSAHSFSPAITINMNEDHTTILEYRFRSSSFKDSELFSNNSVRTGDNHLFGINHTARFGNTSAVRLGYAHDEDRTRKDFWDYSGNKGHGGFSIMLPKESMIDLAGEIYARDYSGINPSTGIRRSDLGYTLSLNGTRYFSSRYGFTLGVHYNRNSSNSSEFEYERTITSLLFTVRL